MESSVASERGPLSVVFDVIVAPRAAFEALAVRPRWLVAFLVTSVLGMLGAYLQAAAQQHLAVSMLVHDPRMASADPAMVQQNKSFLVLLYHFLWLAYPIPVLIGTACGTLILVVGNALARGSGAFARYFAASAHLALINFGIAYLLVGILAATHSPDSFNTQSDLVRVIPSLAWLAPAGTSPKLVALLAAINPGTLWTFGLCIVALAAVGKITRVPAYAIATVYTFAASLMAIAFAK